MKFDSTTFACRRIGSSAKSATAGTRRNTPSTGPDLDRCALDGLAQGAYEHASTYSQEREQFGQPISEFDAIRDTIVDMHRKTERARLLTYRAARTADAGDPVTRSRRSRNSTPARPHARWPKTPSRYSAATATTEFAPQRFYRDAKLMEIGEGTSEIQHLVIGRELGL